MQVKSTAPGRINLIGEHTDYNEGFVLPAAIDYAVTVEGAAVKEHSITAISDNFDERITFSLSHLGKSSAEGHWIDYVKGVCLAFEKAGHRLSGARLSISSRVPVGAGLSSSAALEVAVAAALAALSGLQLPPRELARLSWQAENEYVGVRCGVMDQYAAALSRPGQALLLDCRTLEYEYIPLSLKENRLLIVDSRVERTLAASAYNRRREECEAAVAHLSRLLERPLGSLRDVRRTEFERVGERLPDLLARRSRYVVEENERVLAAAAALREGELAQYGRLMALSHAGLRDLYAVSSAELDQIVELSLGLPGVLGARLTGAGFGGCAIVLLKREAVAETKDRLRRTFARRGWREPHFYLTAAAAGLTLSRSGL